MGCPVSFRAPPLHHHGVSARERPHYPPGAGVGCWAGAACGRPARKPVPRPPHPDEPAVPGPDTRGQDETGNGSHLPDQRRGLALLSVRQGDSRGAQEVAPLLMPWGPPAGPGSVGAAPISSESEDRQLPGPRHLGEGLERAPGCWKGTCRCPWEPQGLCAGLSGEWGCVSAAQRLKPPPPALRCWPLPAPTPPHALSPP